MRYEVVSAYDDDDDNWAWGAKPNPVPCVSAPAYLAGLCRRQKAPSSRGLAYGIPEIDAATGGLHGLTVVAGPAWAGKTTFALQVVRNVLARYPDAGVVYFAYDQVRDDDLLDTLVVGAAGADRDRVLSADPPPAAKRAFDLFRRIAPRLAIIRAGTQDTFGSHDPAYLRGCFRHCAGVKRVVAVIDMLQNVPFALEDDEAEPAGDAADQHRLDRVLRFHLTSLFRDPGQYPTLLLSQVRKGDRARVGLRADDILGATRLQYEADSILLLDPDDGGAPGVTPVTLRIVKARYGSCTDVDLMHRYRECRFTRVGAERAPDSRCRHSLSGGPEA